MQDFFIYLTIFLSLAMIILVSLLPRESQRFSHDRNSGSSRSGYWESRKLVKLLTLSSSILLFLLLFIFMLINH